MIKKILPLTKKLISIPSTSDNPESLRQILAVALSELRHHQIEHFTQKGVLSALVSNRPKGFRKFRVILNVHLDVIPGKANQYKPTVRGDKLFGVGAMDMKGNVASLIMAFKEVAKQVRYPLGMQLVTDEEIGGFKGAKYQVDQGLRADFVIAGEPTNFDIVHEAKGVLWAEVVAKGKTAHGAYPWRGENAIWKINKFLDALRSRYPVPTKQVWVTTVNVSRMETKNRVYNKIPDSCIVGLDVRFIPEQSDRIVLELRRLLPKGCKLNVVTREPALLTDPSNEYIGLLKRLSKTVLKKKIILRGANGSSDARHFARVGGAGIEFGAVGAGIGSDVEWVSISSLAKYYEIITRFLLSLDKHHQ